ncbi:MAG TPA: GNAT family N-acetyltransferase [Cyclobacteriaceae bacterium]|nr:GNAT family N-acetyltransferase [Cyclobacteriaceae bacterium]
MEIHHEEFNSKGAFFLEDKGARLAEMTYSKAGEDKIIIDHTEVDASLKGQGVGKKLLDKAVNFARQNQLKIIPLCPFAKALMHKDPSFHDVLI